MSERLRFYIYLLTWLAAPWPLLAKHVFRIADLAPLFVLHLVLISAANLVWDSAHPRDGERSARFAAKLAVRWFGNLFPAVVGVIAFPMVVGDFHGSASESVSLYLLVLIAATLVSMTCSTMTTSARPHAGQREAQEWGARSLSLSGVLLPWVSSTLVLSFAPGFDPLILLAACACSANIVSVLLSPSTLERVDVPSGTPVGLIAGGLVLVAPAIYLALLGLAPPLVGSDSTISLPILASLALFSLFAAALFYRGSATFARIHSGAA